MIEIRTNGSEVALDFKKLAIDLTRLAPLMRGIAGDLEDSVERAFEQQRDPITGKFWAKLKPATISARRRKNKIGKKLQVTGRLVNSIISSYKTTSAKIGTNVKYAGVHQKGYKHIPQRRFIGLGPLDLIQLRRRTRKYLINRFNLI